MFNLNRPVIVVILLKICIIFWTLSTFSSASFIPTQPQVETPGVVVENVKVDLVKFLELKEVNKTKENEGETEKEESSTLKVALGITAAVITVVFLAIVIRHCCCVKTDEINDGNSGPPRATVSLFAESYQPRVR